MADALTRELGGLLREDQILTSPEDLSVYAFDGTAMLHQRPACVALPESRDEVLLSPRVAVREERAKGWRPGASMI